MLIFWNEPKRLSNIDKHGFDFAALSYDFFLASTIVPAAFGRLMAVGHLDDVAVSVVFDHLGTEGLSVISMRRASRAERRLIA